MPERKLKAQANTSLARGTSDARRRLQRILKTSPQDLWLETIRRANIPAHNALIHWMLAQSECDFAVACHAFYKSDPASHIDQANPLGLRPTKDEIFAQVLLNWDKGYYRTHEIAIEAIDADTRLIRRVNQKLMARPRGALPFSVPSQLLSVEGGAPLHLPPHLDPDNALHLWPLYKELGLSVHPAQPGLKRRMAKAKGIIQKVSFASRR